MHHAYSKHAEVTVPSLDEWEKQWEKNPQGMEKPKTLLAAASPGYMFADWTENKISISTSPIR